MLPSDSESIERREMSRFAPRFHIKLRSHAPHKLCASAFSGKHPGQKKQIARLYRFRVDAERLRGRREIDPKFLQPLLGAGWPGAFPGYLFFFQSWIHVSSPC